MFTTETLEGVETPVTAPPPPDEPPPLQAASRKVSAVKPMPSLEIVASLCWIFMTKFPSVIYRKKYFGDGWMRATGHCYARSFKLRLPVVKVKGLFIRW